MRPVQLLLLVLGAAVSPAAAHTGRLLDGQRAEVGSHPYSVSLQRDGAHICGAALISNRLCLTAAHCVSSGGIQSYPARTFLIRAGSINRLAGGQLAQISDIVVHHGYADGLNDIALLILQQPLILNANTQPIALASEAPTGGTEVIFTGWGALQTQGPLSHYLLEGSRSTLSAADCQKQLFLEHEGLMCLVQSAEEASTLTNGICAGDAGAPAVYKNQLVGIASFYVGGCGSSLPDGFVSVANYLDWVKANTS